MDNQFSMSSENNSGMGKGTLVPPELKGWCWSGFLWNFIWSIRNKTWFGLLTIVPYVGLLFAIILGLKGNEWAWQNIKWQSIDHFKSEQRSWVKWWLILFVGLFMLGMITAILIPLLIGHNKAN